MARNSWNVIMSAQYNDLDQRQGYLVEYYTFILNRKVQVWCDTDDDVRDVLKRLFNPEFANVTEFYAAGPNDK